MALTAPTCIAGVLGSATEEHASVSFVVVTLNTDLSRRNGK